MNLGVVLSCSHFPEIHLRGGTVIHIQVWVARQRFHEKFMSDIKLNLGHLERNTTLDE